MLKINDKIRDLIIFLDNRSVTAFTSFTYADNNKVSDCFYIIDTYADNYKVSDCFYLIDIC